ncbi:MAG: response regulator, partial [Betaproteobacteria bacterium]
QNEEKGKRAVELTTARDEPDSANLAKSRFLATMSHEIRTPMNAVLGMAQVLMQSNISEANRLDYARTIFNSGQTLLALLNDILDLSKIEAGKVELESIAIAPAQLIHETQTLFAQTAHAKGLGIAAHWSGAERRYLGDPNRLRQMLSNLVGNAIKFTSQGEIAVQVRLRQDRGSAVLLGFEVVDHGIGIPADKQASIFEAFTQADTSTTRNYGGTGLGLAISSQLVAAMGGTLGVHSVPGEGSTFGFDVLLALGSTRDKERPSADLQGVSVLIVDDNDTNLRLLSQMLKNWGMQVTSANSAAQALEAVAKARGTGPPFKLVLLDAMMPEVDGFELAEQLHSAPEMSGAVMMMLSPAGMRGDAQRCRELGVLAYLTKPINPMELFNALRIALGAHSDSVLITKHNLNESRLHRQLHILLAEDNAANQKLAVTLLSKWGHRVDVAETGGEAVKKSLLAPYDVILMDLQMPDMFGLEATRLIRDWERTHGRHTPIVAMAANAMSEEQQRCLDAGMDDYLSKPFDVERLRAVLASLTPTEPETASQPMPASSEPAFDYASALASADPWVR